MEVRRALICGISGQDGSYLARLLLIRGYEVFGTSRDVNSANFERLRKLGVDESVSLLSMAPNDFRSVLSVFAEVLPNEVYNLSGQSSVGLSFSQPVEAIESIALATLNMLEAIRFLNKDIRFYNAGSSECFGDTGQEAADERTPFRPRSPYAVAKACAHNLVVNYRDAYKMFCVNGILFNHESPLRPKRFVTQKIITGAASIAKGAISKIQLGNIYIFRDWGWAPDFVEAMWLMLNIDEPDDFVIATGQTTSLVYFIDRVFSSFKLKWTDHVEIDEELSRPSDLIRSAANPSKAAETLGWRATHSIDQIIDMMVQATTKETVLP